MSRRLLSHLRYLPLLSLGLLSSCSWWWFSTVIHPDRSRPVALIELVEKPSRLGVTTDHGIVFLNEDDAVGACRVHYFLGDDLVVESGELREVGGLYHLAEIDLKTPAVPMIDRDLRVGDALVAIVLDVEQGSVDRIDVELASGDVEGYALKWPGRDLPAGAGIFLVRDDKFAGELKFVGLATGLATRAGPNGTEKFITFAGPARIREALALPRPMFRKRKVIHRPDGISVAR